ncbi:MAG: AraC family transcriptional regulator [Bermanella sp.]
MSYQGAKNDLDGSQVTIIYSRLLAREIGINKENAHLFLKGTQLSYEQLSSLDGKISFVDQAQLVKNAMEISNDPALALWMGPKLHLATHGPVGMVLMASANVHTMLAAFAKYSSVRAQFMHMSLEVTEDYLVLEIHDDPRMGDFHDFFYELSMSTLQFVVEEVTGEALKDGRYCFVHEKAEYTSRYEQLLHSPLEFNCERNLFCVPKNLANTPSPYFDQNMLDHATLLCEQGLTQMREEQSIVKVVEKLLFDNPGKIWSLESVAKALNTSQRTLMRKLKTGGLTYKQLQDEVHKEMVGRYLVHKNLSIDRIGYLIGYSDASSFRRSFKRWFGTTPSKYIEKLNSLNEAS